MHFFCSDTFQHVRDTTNKLKMMNKTMIDLSKAGEATECLEQYVSIHGLVFLYHQYNSEVNTSLRKIWQGYTNGMSSPSLSDQGCFCGQIYFNLVHFLCSRNLFWKLFFDLWMPISNTRGHEEMKPTFHMYNFCDFCQFLLPHQTHFFSREKRQLERELQMYKKMAVQQRKDILNSKAKAFY